MMSKELDLPMPLAGLAEAQNNFDSAAFAALFAGDAIVHDEGRDYRGREAIRQWNEATSSEYATQLEPLGFTETGDSVVFKVLVSGRFPGSPLVLNYHLGIDEGRIVSLRVSS